MGKDRDEKIIDDTFSITMELERPLIIDEINECKKQKEKEKKKKIIKKKVLIVLGVFMALLLVGFFVWMSNTYEPGSIAKEALISDNQIEVKINKNIEFIPKDKKVTKGFILYPGTKINPKAYAPLARKVAQAGYEVVILKMPFNMSFLGENNAKSVIENNPNITQWVVGGHSSGGAIASNFAVENNLVDGVVFLSSYPINNKLKGMTKDVLSIWGSKDGVLNFESLVSSKEKLPYKTTYVEIEGANHSQFGDYGTQDGDNNALISEKEQVGIAAKNIINFMKKIN